MTKEERKLWYEFLRNHMPKFTRQKILGNYIVDFYCAAAKLAVEADGSQHYENDALDYDERRTQYLELYGIKVIRIPNNEINENFDGVCEFIENEVKKRIGSPV